MKVVILNWSDGQNDPFTVFNAQLAKMFYKCGKNVITLQLTDNDWATQLRNVMQYDGIEFVYTWQGIGSAMTLAKKGELVFEALKVPLMCIHGDHPSYKPSNHSTEVDNCFHLYTNADFARYSNMHFRKKYAASVIDIPKLFFEEKLEIQTQPVFNFVKNITHTADLEAEWRAVLPPGAAEVYLQAAEVLKYLVKTEPYFEMHEIMDALIVSEKWDWISEQANPGIVHHYHSTLDYYIRSFRSQCVLDELRDVPMHIYGKGWDRYKAGKPSAWEFFDGCDMKDSQKLYYSEYGILDVSPSKRLHDRTRRAMVNQRGFLTSANLEDSFEDLQPHASLFYDFREGQLRTQCEAVMMNPQRHHERARDFAHLYHQTFHFRGFVNRFETLARQVKQSIAEEHLA